MSNSQNDKAITLAELLIPVSTLLDAHVQQDVKVKIIAATATASIYFSENKFPIDIVNTGVPGVDDWAGDHEILDALRAVEAEGFKVEMYPRTDGDETGFVCNGNQDFKLVIIPAE